MRDPCGYYTHQFEGGGASVGGGAVARLFAILMLSLLLACSGGTSDLPPYERSGLSNQVDLSLDGLQYVPVARIADGLSPNLSQQFVVGDTLITADPEAPLARVSSILPDGSASLEPAVEGDEWG